MKCPFCNSTDSKVLDSRISSDELSIRRRRLCLNCKKRFSTVESVVLQVAKRSGIVEPFDRKKIINGVRHALHGRKVNEDDLAKLAEKVEREVRATASSQVDSYDIGLAILDPLRELDEVAYIRFASVYQNFTSLEDFEDAIKSLKNAPSPTQDQV
jgi:transcriptional repressor NrdR